MIQSPAANGDLIEILSSIALDNSTAARRMAYLFDEVFRRLADHPEIGERHPSKRKRNVRLIPVGNYIVYYRTESCDVLILRVWHAARGRGPTP